MKRCRGSSDRVVTGTGWTTGVRLPAGAGILSLRRRIRGTFPGVKRPTREAHHYPPPTAEVKNRWSYTSTSQHVFMASHVVKYRNDFMFLLAEGLHSTIRVVSFGMKHLKGNDVIFKTSVKKP
jgi:hypothetical protein